MQKNKLSVLGVSEVRWTGQGEIRSGDYTVYYSGVPHKMKSVSFLKLMQRSNNLTAFHVQAY